MTADKPTSLGFSLKESVWFQKGQEVAELLSISLYPDIEIQERDFEVVVRGSLLLTGEYIAEEEQEQTFSLRELSPVRTIDSIYIREDGINELSHAFPLEISIPRGRVYAVEDLYVTIESFDYELPESGCLQLIADLSIHGLREETQRQEETELFAEPDIDDDSLAIQEYNEEEEDIFEPFELMERKEPEKVNFETRLPQVDWINKDEELELEHKEEELEYKKTELEHKEEELEFKKAELEHKKAELEHREEELEHAKAELEYKKAEPEYPKVELDYKKEEEVFEYSNRDENALYLTKLFTKEREEEFTKLRMYFVQQGDTIESILERYDITMQQLTRLNDLDDLYVEEGEILYIPVAKRRV